MTTEIEKVFLVVWKEDSSNPGLIENLRYRESELAIHNKLEVLGEHRDYVEAVPGSALYLLYIDASTLTPDHELWDINLEQCTYNWSTGELNLVYKPDNVWDDIRLARNGMLSASDNMFNIDTPDPLKSDWIAYRALLREMISREQAAGRTPSTVFWNDYVPPYPLSARNGVPDDIKPLCVWYVEGKYTTVPVPPAPTQGE